MYSIECTDLIFLTYAQVRKVLKQPSLKYTSVAGNEYVLELRHELAKRAPVDWIRVSATKAFIRYHTPTVKKKLDEREQLRETLAQGGRPRFTNPPARPR